MARTDPGQGYRLSSEPSDAPCPAFPLNEVLDLTITSAPITDLLHLEHVFTQVVIVVLLPPKWKAMFSQTCQLAALFNTGEDTFTTLSQ